MIYYYLAEYMVDMKNNLNVIYEDNHIIVVEKPFNVLSQGDSTKDKDLLTMVKEYLKEKYNKPGNVYVGLVHRLDRPTGGIMVFAKTSKAAARLSKMIKDRDITKKYLAIVHGLLKEEKGTLKHYLLKQEDKSVVVNDEKIGKEAILHYKVIKNYNDLSLLEITLETGRHHQIRVQFNDIGNPLYGDQKYGKQDKKQLALFAYYLEFTHPVSKENMSFTLYPKKEGIWKQFL